MLLAPSSIHFLKTPANINPVVNVVNDVLVETDESVVIELSKKLTDKNELKVIKMQVTEKDGSWFALNNTSLHVMRQLEKQGKIKQIQVEIVPLSKVPRDVQLGMVVDDDIDECVSSEQTNYQHNKSGKNNRPGI